MKQKIMVGGIVFALAGLGLFAFSRSEARPREAHAHSHEQELAELREELESLKQKSAAHDLRRAVETGVQGRVTVLPQPSAETSPEREAAGAPFGGTETPPEMTEEEIAVQLDNHFDAQTRDRAWADRATQEATRAFTENIPAGSQVTKVECRQNLCRVDTEHTDLNAFRAFADATLLSRDRKIWNGGFSTMVRTQTESGVTAVTYVAKEGQPVPGPEPSAAIH